MKNEIVPKLDLKVLQQKANEAAMKGAIEEINNFYNGYSSPYRKAVKEELESKALSIHLDLPDILGRLNESLSSEIDRIANRAIAETFIPLATKALTRIDKNVKFSDILKEFVSCCHDDFEDNRPEVDISHNERFDWLDVVLSYEDYRGKEVEYKIVLHSGDNGRRLLSLPFSDSPYNKKIKLSNGEGSIEMPFTTGSLSDEFTAHLARLILCDCNIEMDCDDFDDEMFEGC